MVVLPENRETSPTPTDQPSDADPTPTGPLSSVDIPSVQLGSTLQDDTKASAGEGSHLQQPGIDNAGAVSVSSNAATQDRASRPAPGRGIGDDVLGVADDDNLAGSDDRTDGLQSCPMIQRSANSSSNTLVDQGSRPSGDWYPHSHCGRRNMLPLHLEVISETSATRTGVQELSEDPRDSPSTTGDRGASTNVTGTGVKSSNAQIGCLSSLARMFQTSKSSTSKGNGKKSRKER
ncbi:hypothetical protein BCR39DRAFT_559906 [Naematelia encephala]|uniref:Uncharacterized protein n=1 Tax=Naematelia encephala TaxID=71784 RepID=A0A1Y2AYI4_9TREE|nr:hypothetical protein BCR39DRAFT_559906 [Naematelia encephala]